MAGSADRLKEIQNTIGSDNSKLLAKLNKQLEAQVRKHMCMCVRVKEQAELTKTLLIMQGLKASTGVAQPVKISTGAPLTGAGIMHEPSLLCGAVVTALVLIINSVV